MKNFYESGQRLAVRLIRQTGVLLFPPACAVCDRVLKDRRALVCDECAGKLPWVRQPKCLVCGRPLGETAGSGRNLTYAYEQEIRREKCSFCESRTVWFDRGESTFCYTAGIRESVLRMKFRNRRDHLDFYAVSMASAHERFLETVSPEVIIPVPMHKRKVRERGFDQCALLAEKLFQKTQIPVLKNALVRTRYTKPQKGLDAGLRRENLAGAFAPGPALYGGRNRKAGDDSGCMYNRVLLIDDIYTTGTTLNEACRTLRLAGVQNIFFLTLCVVPDR